MGAGGRGGDFLGGGGGDFLGDGGGGVVMGNLSRIIWAFFQSMDVVGFLPLPDCPIPTFIAPVLLTPHRLLPLL